MTPQPIQTHSSAESSPIITPSGTPPPFLAHGFEGRLHHFFSSFEGAGSSGKGVQADDECMRRKSETGVAGPSRASSFTLPTRPNLPFFSGLSLSRPLPHPQYTPQQPMQSIGMAKQPSSGGSSDTSSTSTTERAEPKRSATMPVAPTALLAMEKRHYDPSREPKLLHFM